MIVLLSAAFLGGCGDTTEPAGNGQQSAELPRKLAELPENGETPFHLVVSNQSFDTDPVRIDVYVDDVRVVTGDFKVEGQHSYHTFDFSTAPGTHHVRAVTVDGIEIEEDVVLTEETWGILMFWHYATAQGGAEVTPKSLSWSTRDSQPMWD
jgi:hypothetical protein